MKYQRVVSQTVLALVLGASASMAWADPEWGKLLVFSKLNEPFNASIPMKGYSEDQKGKIKISIASAEAYQKAGLQRPTWMNDAQVSVQWLEKGKINIKIKTTQPVEELVSTLWLEMVIDGESGQSQKEYAVMLDPQEGEKIDFKNPQETPVKVSTGKGSLETAQKEAENAAVAGLKKETAGKVESSDKAVKEKVPSNEVKVKPGQILYAIAQQKKPEEVTVEKMMIGLLRANPLAFENKNINRLKSGVILRIPSKEELQSLSQKEAVDRINEQMSDFQQWKKGSPIKVTEMHREKTTQKEAQGVVEKAKKIQNQDKVLTLDKANSQSPGKSLEDQWSKKEAKKDEASRLKDLERMKKDLKELMTIQKQLPGVDKSEPANAEEDKKSTVKTETENANDHAKEDKKDLESAPASSPDSKAASEPAPSKEVSASQPEVKPKEVVIPKRKVAVPVEPPAPAAEPSLLDFFMDYGSYGSIAGLSVLLLGALGLKWRQKNRKKIMKATTVGPEDSVDISVAESVEKEAEKDPRMDISEWLNAADAFCAFKQYDKALQEIEKALSRQPNSVEALIYKARVLSRQGLREPLSQTAAAIGDVTFKEGPYWKEVVQLLAECQESLNTNDRGDVVKQESGEQLSIELEQSLKELEELGLTTSSDMESSRAFEVSVGNVLKNPHEDRDLSLNLPETPLELTEVITDSKTSHAPELSREASDEPLEFMMEGLSFDLTVPEEPSESVGGGVKVNERVVEELPSLKMEDWKMEDLNLGFEMPSDIVKASTGEGDVSEEVKNMFELALAYKDMEDWAGARDLLNEIIKEGNQEWREKAEKELSSLKE